MAKTSLVEMDEKNDVLVNMAIHFAMDLSRGQVS